MHKCLPNGFLVNCFSMIGSNKKVFEVFEHTAEFSGDFSTYQRFDNRLFGSVASIRGNKEKMKSNEIINKIKEAFPEVELMNYRYDTLLGRIEEI